MNDFVSDLIAQIFSLKKIKECLKLRMFWIKDGFAKKSEFEKMKLKLFHMKHF